MADHLVGGLRCADVADLAASFVLGALERAEADAVRRHLAGCPEAHAEIAELGSVVPALFDAVDVVQPSPALRERILGAAAADTQRSADTQRVIEIPRLADTQPARSSPGLFRRPVWAALGIAAALALVALGAWNVQLREEYNALTAYRNGVAAVIDAGTRPGAQLAVLGPPDGATGPSGLAVVGADGAVKLVMAELKPTAGSQVYEAWLIAENASPVAVGGFTVGAGGSAVFDTTHASLGAGVTVALTLEPVPGATKPLGPIVAVGKAAAPRS